MRALILALALLVSACGPIEAAGTAVADAAEFCFAEGARHCPGTLFVCCPPGYDYFCPESKYCTDAPHGCPREGESAESCD